MLILAALFALLAIVCAFCAGIAAGYDDADLARDGMVLTVAGYSLVILILAMA